MALLLQHGSTVTGHPDAGSDLDLAVLFDRPCASPDAVDELTSDLREAFPDQDVDLVVVNHADPLLLRCVVEQPRLLYGTALGAAALRVQALPGPPPVPCLEREYVRRQIATVRQEGGQDRDPVTRKLLLIVRELDALRRIQDGDPGGMRGKPFAMTMTVPTV